MMTRVSLVAALCMLIACIVCDDDNNVTTSVTSTTPPPSTTTTVTGVTASLENSTAQPASPNHRQPSNRTRQLNTTSYACSCDSTFNCDVNCCCDLDCSDEMVKAFACTNELDIDDFYHGEGLERCALPDSSLLCIAHDNVPSVDFNLHAPFHVEYSSYEWPKNLLAAHALEPHRPATTASSSSSSHDFYQYGDAIRAYDMRSEKFQTINVPAYTIGASSRCFLTEPVKFLKSKSIKCLRSINDLCAYNNELMLQLLNAQTRRPPKSTPYSKEETFEIVIESCKHSHSNCTQISHVNGAEALEQLLSDDVYEDIHFTFITNDTKISSVAVKFSCRNELTCEGDDFEPSPKIAQTINVHFVNANENRHERRVRMKSRGYRNEETIIASRYRPLNATASSSEMVFDYFRNDTRDYRMRLPINGRGKCSNDRYETIRFNQNSQTSCRVEVTRDVGSNFTACQQAQHQLLHFLFHTLNLTSNYSRDGYGSDVFVSKFWTPRHGIESWTRASVQNVPLWSPEMQESEKMVICSHIITAANYKFIYSTLKTSGTKKYENFIEAVTVELEHVDELHLPLDDDVGNGTTLVEIQINVQFISLYQKNTKSHASITKLPFLCFSFALFLLIVGA